MAAAPVRPIKRWLRQSGASLAGRAERNYLKAMRQAFLKAGHGLSGYRR
jgi:hypothetical protein